MTDQELKEVQMMIVQALTAIDELIEARKKIEELEIKIEDLGYQMMEIQELNNG